MPSEAIFGDEDSSDESEVGEKKPETPSNKDVEMKDADDGDAEKKKPESNPFDSDDDSDSDKKKGSAEEKKPAAAEEKTEEKDPFAEEDSDDSEGKKKEDTPKKPAIQPDDSDDDEEVGAEKKSPAKDNVKKSNDEDDDLEDSDEDDVEFDDSAAVTGTSHNKGFQKKVSKKKSALDMMREAEEADEAEARADADEDEAPKKPAPPKVDPRTMVVVEPDRPDSNVTMHVTKLPNLVGVQPEAFDPDTYSSKAEEDEYKRFVHDMIRWRYKKDKSGNLERDEEGNLLRESNARLVQWEDGSYTLHVGNEALIVDSVDSSQKVGAMDVVTGRTPVFAGLNGYLYLSQMANYREEKKDDDDDDEGEVDKDGFKVTAAGTVLECMGSVGSRMTARPSSLRSEAHKSHTVAVRKKTIKRAQIAEIVTQLDPEKEKEERIKDQEAMHKEKARKRSGADNYRNRNRGPRPGMNRRYLEDDGDFDSTNLRAIKKRTMDSDDDGYGDEDDYGDDDDDDDEETFNRKRPRKRAPSKSVDSDDEDEDDGPASSGNKKEEDEDKEESEDEDDEVITPVKTGKKRAHQAVFDDDDSD